MLGSFGDIIFETSDKRLLNFEGFKRDTASVYENHKLMGQKPRTEFVAPGLDTVTFTVILRSRFGVKPRDEMNRWLEYTRNGNAEILEIGGRALGVDKWVVTSASQHWDTIFNRGELVSGKVDVTLQEYVSSMWTVKAYQERLERLEAQKPSQNTSQSEPESSQTTNNSESSQKTIANDLSQSATIFDPKKGEFIENVEYLASNSSGSSSSISADKLWYLYTFESGDGAEIDIFLSTADCMKEEMPNGTVAVVKQHGGAIEKKVILNSGEWL